MIVIKTRYTLELYKKYYWFYLFRGKYYRYGQAFFLAVTALTIALSAWALFGRTDLVGMILFPALAVICLLLYAAWFILPGRYVRRYPALFNADLEIVFREDDFSTRQSGDLVSGEARLKYESIQKVYETRDALYIYTAPGAAVLLAKDAFARGAPEDLRKLLAAKLPRGKYIVCK